MEPIESTQHELTESPMHEIETGDTGARFLEFQCLKNYSIIPGATPYNFLPAFYAETPPGSWTGFWYPGVTYRQNYRKHYAQNAFVYTHSSPTANWSSTGTLSGSGNCPQLPNFPGWIDISGSIEYPGTAVEPFYTFQAPVWHDYGIVPGQDGSSFTSYTSTVSGSMTWTLSSPISFASILSDSITELSGRSFPAFTGGWTFYEQYRDEYGIVIGPVGTPPSSYTGSWLDSPGVIDTSPAHPFFGCNLTNPALEPLSAGESRFLWSGWYYESTEEQDNTFSAVPQGLIWPHLITQRVRFRLDSALSYFFASAVISHRPGPLTNFTPSADDIVSAHVITTGTTVAGTTYEIPLPSNTNMTSGYDDFITCTLPVHGGSTLSFGAMVFCIIGETPAAWSARTGIPYT